jgi:hypothetical protein
LFKCTSLLFDIAARLVRSLSLIGILVGGVTVWYLAERFQAPQCSTAFDEHRKIVCQQMF